MYMYVCFLYITASNIRTLVTGKMLPYLLKRLLTAIHTHIHERSAFGYALTHRLTYRVSHSHALSHLLRAYVHVHLSYMNRAVDHIFGNTPLHIKSSVCYMYVWVTEDKEQKRKKWNTLALVDVKSGAHSMCDEMFVQLSLRLDFVQVCMVLLRFSSHQRIRCWFLRFKYIKHQQSTWYYTKFIEVYSVRVNIRILIIFDQFHRFGQWWNKRKIVYIHFLSNFEELVEIGLKKIDYCANVINAERTEFQWSRNWVLEKYKSERILVGLLHHPSDVEEYS